MNITENKLQCKNTISEINYTVREKIYIEYNTHRISIQQEGKRGGEALLPSN